MSASVDDKVVKLGFNGSGFTAGIAKATDALTNFKSKLNFDAMAAKMQSINSVTFEPIMNSLAELQYRFSAMGQAASTIVQRLTNGVIDAAKSVEQATIGQIKSGGWSRAMNIANAQFQIEGLGYSWEKVEKAVSYGVKDTAYGLDAAASAASQLAASGVDFQKVVKTVNGQGLTQMHRSLRAISGVAAMTNSSYEEISHIFTTIAGNGKVMTEQLRMLSSRGLNAAAILGKQLGATEADVYDMVSKGEIDFQKFADAMDDAFGQHAKDANKTFQGSLSNMKAALSRIGALFATPVIEKTNVFFNSITGQIDKFKAALSDFKDDKGKTVAGFATHFAEAWERGVEALSKVVDMLDISWFNNVASAADDAAVKVRDFFTVFQEKFFPKEKEDEGEKAKKTTDKVTKAVKKRTQAEINAAAKMRKEREEALEQSEKVRKEIEDFNKLPMAAHEAASKAGIAIKKNTDLVRLTEKQYDQSLQYTQAAKDQMFKAGLDVYGKYGNDALDQAAKDVMNKAGVYDYDKSTKDDLTFAEKAYNYFEKTLTIFRLGMDTAKALVEFVKAALNPVIKAFKNVFDPDEMFDSVTRFTGSMKKFAEELSVPSDAANTIQATFEKLFMIVKKVAGKFSDLAASTVKFARYLLENGFFRDLFNIVVAFKNIIVDFVKPFKTMLQSIFKVNTTTSSLADSFKRVSGWLSDFITNLGDGLKKLKVYDDLAYIVVKLLDTVGKIIKPIIVAFKDAFNITDAGGGGMALTIKKITSTVADMVSKINISNGVIAGIYNFFTVVFTTIKVIAKIVANVVIFIVNSVKALWDSGIIQTVFGKIAEFVGGLFDFSDDVRDRSKKLESGSSDQGFLKKFLGNFMDGLKSLTERIDVGQLIKLLLAIKVITLIVGAFVSVGKIVKWGLEIATWPQKVSWMLGNLNGLFLNLKKWTQFMILPSMLYVMAQAMLIAAGAMMALAAIPQDRFEQGMMGMLFILGIFWVVQKVLTKFLQNFILMINNMPTIVGRLAGTLGSIALFAVLLAFAVSEILTAVALVATVRDSDTLLMSFLGAIAMLVILYKICIYMLDAVSYSPLATTTISNGMVKLLLIGVFMQEVAGALVIMAASAKIISSAGSTDRILASSGAAALLMVVMVLLTTKMIQAMSMLPPITPKLLGAMALISHMMIMLSVSIVIIAAAMAILGTIPEQSVPNVMALAAIVAGVLLIMSIIVPAIAHLTSASLVDPVQLIGMLGMMFLISSLIWSLAESMAVIMGAMVLVKDINPEQFTDVILPMFLVIAIVIVAITAVSAVLAHFTSATFLTLFGIMGLVKRTCAGIAMVLESLVALNGLDPEAASAGVTAIIFVVLAIIAILAASTMLPNKGGMLAFGISILIISVALSLVTYAISAIAKEFEDTSWSSVFKALAAVVVVAIMISVIATKTRQLGTATGLLALGVMAVLIGVAVVAIAFALQLLDDTKNAFKNGLLVLGFMITMVGMVYIIGKKATMMRKIEGVMMSLGVTFVLVAVSMIAFAYALKEMSSDQITWKGIVVMAVIIAIFIGLAALAGAFPAIAEGILTISTAIFAIGLGFTAVGLGAWLFAKGMEALGPALVQLRPALEGLFQMMEENKGAAIMFTIIIVAIVVALTVMIVKLSPLLAQFGKAIGNGIKGIGQTLVNGMTKFNGWWTGLSTRSQVIIASLIGSICAAIMVCSPDILDTIGYLIQKLFWYLGSIMGDLAEGLVNFIVALAYAVADAVSHHSHAIIGAIKNLVLALIKIIIVLIEDTIGELSVNLKAALQQAENDIDDLMKQNRIEAEDEDYWQGVEHGWINAADAAAKAGDEAENADKRTKDSMASQVKAWMGLSDAAEESAKKVKEEYASLPQAGRDQAIKAGVDIYEEDDGGIMNFLGIGNIREALVNGMDMGEINNMISSMNFLQGQGASFDPTKMWNDSLLGGDELNQMLSQYGVSGTDAFEGTFNIADVANGEYSNLLNFTGNDMDVLAQMTAAGGNDANNAWTEAFLNQDDYYATTSQNMQGVDEALAEQEEKLKTHGRLIGEGIADSLGAGLSSKWLNMAVCTGHLLDGITTAVTQYTEITGPALMDGLCEALYNTFREFNEIDSPSKLYKRTSSYIVQGISNGIDSETSMATGAMTTLSDTMVDAFGNPLTRVANLMNSDVEFDPSIRPVVDMSSVGASASGISSMFDNQNVSLSGFSGKLAADITGLDDSNRAVVEELRSLREDMAFMTEQINGMQVVMDSGHLVGAISAPMDRALGARSRLGRRR